MTLFPTDEHQLSDAISGAKSALQITGGGTRGVSCAGDLLSTAKISGIRLYDPGALTIVAAAGTPLNEIEAALAAKNLGH